MTPEINFGDGYCLESCNLQCRLPDREHNTFQRQSQKGIFAGSAVVKYECLLALNMNDCCLAACKYDKAAK
jgi:hypothetical protein